MNPRIIEKHCQGATEFGSVCRGYCSMQYPCVCEGLLSRGTKIRTNEIIEILFDVILNYWTNENNGMIIL